MERNKIYIYGKHAVLQALLHAPAAVNKVFISTEVRDAELNDAVRNADVALGRLKGRSTKGGSGSGHQGVFASISMSKLMQPYEAFINELKPGPDTALVFLEELTDPHNVGAIIRSAAALGAAGVLLPKKGQAPVTGAVIKVSAGMAFRIPLIAVADTAPALRDLKTRGFNVYGLASGAKRAVSEPAYDAPAVFVFGNESRGLTKKTVQVSDEILSVPIHPRAESLNVAAAAAVTLHVWSVRHPKALG
jgi:23S rRNA (guanosine2251-2'-O)-methyltransferase